MAIGQTLKNLFYGPQQQYAESLLGKTNAATLGQQATGATGLNTLLYYLMMPKNQGYGSAFDPRYLSQAFLMGGLPAGQQTYKGAMDFYKTKTELDIAKQKLQLDKFKATTTDRFKNYTQAINDPTNPFKGSFTDFMKMPDAYQMGMFKYTTGENLTPYLVGQGEGGYSPRLDTTKVEEAKTAPLYEYIDPETGDSIVFPNQEALDKFKIAIGK
jgi:hypothetical protein